MTWTVKDIVFPLIMRAISLLSCAPGMKIPNIHHVTLFTLNDSLIWAVFQTNLFKHIIGLSNGVFPGIFMICNWVRATKMFYDLSVGRTVFVKALLWWEPQQLYLEIMKLLIMKATSVPNNTRRWKENWIQPFISMSELAIKFCQYGSTRNLTYPTRD